MRDVTRSMNNSSDWSHCASHCSMSPILAWMARPSEMQRAPLCAPAVSGRVLVTRATGSVSETTHVPDHSRHRCPHANQVALRH